MEKKEIGSLMPESELSFRSQFMKLAQAAKISNPMTIRTLNCLLRYQCGVIKTMEEVEDLYNRMELTKTSHIKVRKKDDPNDYTWPPRNFGRKCYEALGTIIQEWKDEKADVANDIPEEMYAPRHAKKQQPITDEDLAKALVTSLLGEGYIVEGLSTEVHTIRNINCDPEDEDFVEYGTVRIRFGKPHAKGPSRCNTSEKTFLKEEN